MRTPPRINSVVVDHEIDRPRRHNSKSSPSHLLLTYLVSMGAVIIAFVVAHHVTNTVIDALYYTEDWNAATNEFYDRRSLQGSHLRNAHLASELNRHQQQSSMGTKRRGNLKTDWMAHSYRGKNMTLQPKVAWLMSFPNSGTSFTIHLMRGASNYTTATNYGLEGEIKDEPSVPAITGKNGEQGPWLEIIRKQPVVIPNYILTKTHCRGFCHNCALDRTIQTFRSFRTGCLTSVRAVETTKGDLERIPMTYDASLVHKAIHLYRHPLDNTVARFHLEHKAREGFRYEKSAEGFREWCHDDDKANRELFRTAWIDPPVKDLLRRIPCFNEFFRYVQWHNLASVVTDDLGIPVLTLHYDEYARDLDEARDKLLDFLELPLVGKNVEFQAGKEYLDHYTPEERGNIRAFLKEYSSKATWNQLGRYDFMERDEKVSIEKRN